MPKFVCRVSPGLLLGFMINVFSHRLLAKFVDVPSNGQQCKLLRPSYLSDEQRPHSPFMQETLLSSTFKKRAQFSKVKVVLSNFPYRYQTHVTEKYSKGTPTKRIHSIYFPLGFVVCNYAD